MNQTKIIGLTVTDIQDAKDIIVIKYCYLDRIKEVHKSFNVDRKKLEDYIFSKEKHQQKLAFLNVVDQHFQKETSQTVDSIYTTEKSEKDFEKLFQNKGESKQ